MQTTTLTALGIGAKIKSGDLTVADAVTSALAAIDAKNKPINAVLTVEERQSLLATAADVQAKIETGKLTSPLAGVPLGIKDNICTKNLRTTCASKMLDQFISPYDATVIERLRDAGVIPIAKLNLDEFAIGSTSETSFYGAVHNPWDLERVAGGSSSGSAAAVAAGLVCASLGSDTGGSIRQPASHCGVTGFKPTYGVVSRYGAVAYVSSMDQIGPITRDVADAAAILDIISGKDPLDGMSLELPPPRFSKQLNNDIAGKRIALPRESFGDNVDAAVQDSIRQTAEIFRAQGAVVEEIDLPFLEMLIPAYYIIATAEASSNLSKFDGVKYGHRAAGATNIEELYRKTRNEGFGNETIKRILLGTFVLSSGYYDAYYKKALQVKARIVQHFNDIFANFDAILSPVAPTTAPHLGESLADSVKLYLADVFTASANLVGLPALSVPCGFDKKGLPIGAQIIGAHLADGLVLNLGHAFQTVTNFHKQMPKGGAF